MNDVVMNPDQALSEMDLVWPEPPQAVASYLPIVQDGSSLTVSGQLPFVQGQLIANGRLGHKVSLEAGQAAAMQCALNALSLIRQSIDGQWNRLARIVRVGVYVACDEAFTQQAVVANGASDFLVEILGERGRHARAAVGCVSLPLGAPVEVEVLAKLTTPKDVHDT